MAKAPRKTDDILSVDTRRKMLAAVAGRVEKDTSVPTIPASVDLVSVTQWASIGNLALDRIMGGGLPGGIPMGPRRGRVVHLAGDPSTGKSMLLDHIFLAVQKMNGVCLRTETEGTAEAHYARQIGVDLSLVHIQRPNTLEEAFDGGVAWCNEMRALSQYVPIVWGFDTLETIEAGRTFQVMMSGKAGGAHQYGGGRPAAIGSGCRKMSNICNHSPTSFVMLNQVREEIGVMFGNRKRTPGGKAPKFMATIEVMLSSSKFGRIKEGDNVVGCWVHARTIKNKVAPPHQVCDFLIDYRHGVNKHSGLLELLILQNRIKKMSAGEFADVRSGEVWPMARFVEWVYGSGVLDEAGMTFGSDERRAHVDEPALDAIAESEDDDAVTGSEPDAIG
jgi:recombination protein RecA